MILAGAGLIPRVMSMEGYGDLPGRSQRQERNGIEVADWYRPSRLEHAHVAWLGEAIGLSPVGLYTASFKNPYPEKRVISIDVVSSKTTAIPGIIALSTGDLRSAKPQ